jgi:hypothetical protein
MRVFTGPTIFSVTFSQDLAGIQDAAAGRKKRETPISYRRFLKFNASTISKQGNKNGT